MIYYYPPKIYKRDLFFHLSFQATTNLMVIALQANSLIIYVKVTCECFTTLL